ncbi:MAG: ATP-binding protein [Rhodanobacteraceae bacterium]|nr:MAG: ATP-binding protein [Rhodanobacteraceae bacterium]
MPRFYPRFDTRRVQTALRDTPVVLLNGPRQSGKTTLAHNLLGAGRTFRTLDDDSTLAAANTDPTGFLRGARRLTIDEVQRAPALLRAIKKVVDEDRQPGRFLLTGSTNVLSLPHAADSLAGRMAVIDLLPLAQSELALTQPGFLRAAFAGAPSPLGATAIGKAIERIVLTGGYPEMLRRRDPARRAEWARNYLRAIVQRDVRDIASVEKLGQMPRLLRALAHYSGQLANYSQLGGQLSLDAKTARKYVDIFQQLFLVRSLEPWSANRLTRLIKTPKLHFLDSGLLAVLLGVTETNVATRRKAFGAILESFVFAEITKLVGWAADDYQLYHYRDKDQDEVDIVIESAAGDVVGVEVKAAATASATDFRGLHKLAGTCGRRFRCGIVLYDGDTTLPFGPELFAAPISNLWAAAGASSPGQ